MILELDSFESKVPKTCNSQNLYPNLTKQDGQLLINFLSKKSYCLLSTISKLKQQHFHELLI